MGKNLVSYLQALGE